MFGFSRTLESLAGRGQNTLPFIFATICSTFILKTRKPGQSSGWATIQEMR